MSALDELRELLLSARSSAFDYLDAVMVEDIDRIFDTFEAEHPGLIDETVVCDCGEIWPDGSHIYRSNRRKRFVCPVCEGRGG